MAYQYFGQWLLAKNLISPEILSKAAAFQQQQNQPLGAIAIELGILTSSQVEKIIQKQQITDRQFGQIAQDSYLLKASEVEGLLAEQKKRRILLGGALIKLGFIDAKILQREILAHLDYQRDHQQTLSLCMSSIPHARIVQTFIDISIKMFRRITHENFLIDSVNTKNPGTDQSFYCFQQEVVGDKPFNLVFALTEEVILNIEEKLHKEKSSSINSYSLNAVKEFLNIISGNACIKARENQVQLKINPSKVIAIDSPGSSTAQNIIANLISPQQRLQLQMSFL